MADKICPACSKPLQVRDVAEYNMDSYGNPVLVSTLCCRTLLTLYPVRSFNVRPYHGKETSDDWGHDGKKMEMSNA